MTIEQLPEGSTAGISRCIIADFFQQTGISIRAWRPGPDRDLAERRVREKVATWDFRDVPPQRLERHTVASIHMATTTFGHTHPDVQLHIALYTVLGLCIDDLEVDAVALAEFIPRLHSGAPQLHPILDYLVENLQDLPKYFSPYAASAIFAATVQGINSTLFDKQLESLPLTSDSLPYVLYKRARNSLGEAYGFFVWDKFNFPDISMHIQVIADTMVFLNYANDILSFYKEELDGEASNFVHDQAVVTGQTISQVLSGLLQEVAASVKRGRVLLKGDKEKETWERFITGYVAFHFYSPRYRLIDLTGTNYINPDFALFSKASGRTLVSNKLA